ncbi:MAG TPA: ATPase, T2SS/T4P/T4SS family, partial [Hyphomicrobiaceae bacterium]|nr:ATPase, T2SS/T4P/T4SS family [Hyphomicrobiaceae bacterium]
MSVARTTSGKTDQCETVPDIGAAATPVEADGNFAGVDDPISWPQRPACADELSLSFLREHLVFPLADTAAGLAVAMADVEDTYAVRAVALATQRKVLVCSAAVDEIERAIERWARECRPQDEPIGERNIKVAVRDDVEHLKDLALDTPVVQFVNDLLQDAIYGRVTDIHLEPFDGHLAIRVRVDGMLRDIAKPPGSIARAIVSRLKILSGLDISERRLPQDGRTRLRVAGRQIDMRVATIPTIHGEAMAIRLLDNVRRTLDFNLLGFSSRDAALLEQQLSLPHGMILVTGPTGSGKTTSLATGLSKLNDRSRKILTIEDPIEYE